MVAAPRTGPAADLRFAAGPFRHRPGALHLYIILGYGRAGAGPGLRAGTDRHSHPEPLVSQAAVIPGNSQPHPSPHGGRLALVLAQPIPAAATRPSAHPARAAFRL